METRSSSRSTVVQLSAINPRSSTHALVSTTGSRAIAVGSVERNRYSDGPAEPLERGTDVLRGEPEQGAADACPRKRTGRRRC